MPYYELTTSIFITADVYMYTLHKLCRHTADVCIYAHTATKV